MHARRNPVPGVLGWLLAATAAIATPVGVAQPTLDLMVVVEPDVVLRSADIREVGDSVRRIWRPAANVTMAPILACGYGGQFDQPLESPTGLASLRPFCVAAPVAGESVTLVFTSRVRRTRGPALGWVDFVEGEPRPVITVSVTEVTALMHAGRWHGRALDSMPGLVRDRFMRRALTSAVAHELGHYLLKSQAHTAHGVMQANFSVDDIMDSGTALERLAPDEITRVVQRAALAARAED
jgi:hypothetical protein